MIPTKFANVGKIMLFWNTHKVRFMDRQYVKGYDKIKKSGINRIKEVVNAFFKQSNRTNVDDTTEQFETYFRENHKSLYAFADISLRIIQIAVL